MLFNVNKCTIMSVSKENWAVEYPLSNNTLGKTHSVSDLGVQVSSDLRPRQQYILARNRAKQNIEFYRQVCDKYDSRDHSEVVFSTS